MLNLNREKKSTISPEEDFLNEDFCRECQRGGDYKIQDKGQYICKYCGYVISLIQNIDFSPEWRGSFEGDGVNRVRGSLLPSMSSSDRTIVLGTQENNQFKKWQQKFLPTPLYDRNQKVIMDNIEIISKSIYLEPSDSLEIKKLVHEVLKLTLIRGRSIRTIVIAVVCLVLRNKKIPKTIKEVALKLKITKKELGRAVKFVKSTLKIKTKVISPFIFMNRFVKSFKMEESCLDELNWYLSELAKTPITIGKGPISIAGSVFFFYLKKKGRKITQSLFLEKTTITEVTLKFINLQVKPFLVKLSKKYDDIQKSLIKKGKG